MPKGRKVNRSSSTPPLVYFEDLGAVYDAPIDAVWDFMEKDEEFHPKAHKSTVRNFKAKRLSKISVLLRWEVLEDGRWVKRNARVTEIRPSVRILEELGGPEKGSKTVHTYTPRGTKTVVDVLNYRYSTKLTPAQLKRKWLARLKGAYNEDLPYFRKFAQKWRRTH